MKRFFRHIALAFMALTAIACEKNDDLSVGRGSEDKQTKADFTDRASRGTSKETRHVMLYYVAGYNDLCNYLREDVQELASGEYLPGNKRNDNVLLIYSKLATARNDFSVSVNPVLIRVYKNDEGEAVMDTLHRWVSTMKASDAETLQFILETVRSEFPAKDYGMILTSHATGWVPMGYYSSPSSFKLSSASAKQAARTSFPYALPEDTPDNPLTKTIGRDLSGVGSLYRIDSEMEIEDFAAAIPYKMKYILFDACLMGGIETAYALRGKTETVGFSQTEVLADGFAYNLVANRLVEGEPDPAAVCRDYFEQYEKRSGVYQSATISLINCDRLDALAGVCANLFEKYRTPIRALPYTQVQPFGRYMNETLHNWYFDLQDILVKAGITTDEAASLQEALDACVVYKGATKSFMKGSNGFDIDAYCGLSMYLPSIKNAYLDNYYKTLSWNAATKLVE